MKFRIFYYQPRRDWKKKEIERVFFGEKWCFVGCSTFSWVFDSVLNKETYAIECPSQGFPWRLSMLLCLRPAQKTVLWILWIGDSHLANVFLSVPFLTLWTLANILGARRHLAKQPETHGCTEAVTVQVAAHSLQGCMNCDLNEKIAICFLSSAEAQICPLSSLGRRIQDRQRWENTVPPCVALWQRKRIIVT